MGGDGGGGGKWIGEEGVWEGWCVFSGWVGFDVGKGVGVVVVGWVGFLGGGFRVKLGGWQVLGECERLWSALKELGKKSDFFSMISG